MAVVVKRSGGRRSGRRRRSLPGSPATFVSYDFRTRLATLTKDDGSTLRVPLPYIFRPPLR